MSAVLVTKENGEREPFAVSKLIHSLQRSGASDSAVKAVVSGVESVLKEGMQTKDIYKTAFSLLRKIERPVAARYSLKRAVLELGPSGFPFEDFIAEIFRAKGFVTSTREHLQGLCVTHEVDFLAKQKNQTIIGEAKFHNVLGMKSDLKVALYVAARLEDIKKAHKKNGSEEEIEGWLVTNTKFTKSAIDYANCANLKVISWTYPRFGNLQDLIEGAGIHPLTCLTSLNRQEKNSLMSQGIILCKSIEENREAFARAGIKGVKLEKVLEEGRNLCKSI